MTCPCGSNKNYDTCCGPFHHGEEHPATAEQLMRSRYCAFVVKEFDYLEETTDPQTNLKFDHVGNRAWGESVELFQLEILHAEEAGTKATVEFKAHFREGSQEKIHHELSRFRKQAGIWYFREGKVFKT